MPASSSITDHQIRLRDGRRLGYVAHGPPDGKPVLLFHGVPGSRLLRHPDPSIATALHVRLIVPDRPGMGLSDGKPGRGLLDWPADVVDRIPDCSARFSPGEGHLVFITHWEEILRRLTSCVETV